MKYTIRWGSSSDDELLAKMYDIIHALKNQDIHAASVIPDLDVGRAAYYIFGDDGHPVRKPEVISTWFSLLVILASSKDVTGNDIASSFTQGCGGCMVYTLLMIINCYPSNENKQLVFDFFRHILADPKGEILELDEINAFALLLAQNVRPRQDGTIMRYACLELRVLKNRFDISSMQKEILQGLSDLVEGLGALCTSKSFAMEMKTNSSSNIEIIKESIRNKTISDDFVRKQWPSFL